MTALLLAAVLAADPPAADPKLVPATRDEVKELLERHKQARPRLPLPPPADPSQPARVNNGRFREHYLPAELRGVPGFGRTPDPATTLDNTFKVKLFWVTSRVNNCYYCLGHQEQKLLAAGQSDDEVAALDGDWAGFSAADRAALAFTRKLTFAPHELTADDVAVMKKHYAPGQVLEVLVTVAGYNAMNRWTDGLNIPAEPNGNFFKKGEGQVDLSTFKTPTSAKYAGAVSRVAALPEKCKAAAPPAWAARPSLPDRKAVEAAWASARDRKPELPLGDDEATKAAWNDPAPAPNWVRLLATFPKAAPGQVAAVRAAAEKGTLPPRLKGLIAWTAARHDRAWYALALAREQLKAVGLTDDQIFGIDSGEGQSDAERVAVALARKLTVAPATVADADVEAVRKHYPDKQVAEIVHQICAAAFFDRVTETARLPLDAPAKR